jgi:hypothetical protein
MERQPHSDFQICLYLWFGEGGGEYLCVVILTEEISVQSELGGFLLVLMEGQLFGKKQTLYMTIRIAKKKIYIYIYISRVLGPQVMIHAPDYSRV